MVIDKIILGGIYNIGKTVISLCGLDALVAPNNYGKSNILAAIEFGIDFIENTEKKKFSQMNYRPGIPINSTLEGEPFRFELEGTLYWNENLYNYAYGYSFIWAKTTEEDKGARIIEEYLKLKGDNDSKFKSFISRSETASCYLASETGRCSKVLPLMRNQLAINKLLNFDDLFYLPVIEQFNNLEIRFANTLNNPDNHFSMLSPNDDVNELNLKMPNDSKIGFFINSLKELDSNNYELLKSAVLDLLPHIDDFEPMIIDLRKESDDSDKKVPFRLPDTLYSIKVKESYNNQYTSIEHVSSGCKRILYVLTLAIAANINNYPLILFEELENSVHPRLLQNLLMAVKELAGETKILLTSHSPYLLKYLSPEQIKLGMPNNNSGVAVFKEIKPSKFSKIMRLASAEESSLGEYLFDLMLDLNEEDELLNEYFI